MDKISIIVPCYNQAEYIPRCLNSLLGQTYGDIEIICVNDASTDATIDVLKEYAGRDDRIKIVEVEHGGQGRARNYGIQEATGKYLMFCDSDDEFMPEACEKLHKGMVDNDCDVALCSAKVIYGSDFNMKSSDDAYYTLKFSGVIRDSHSVINQVDVSVCNKIFKRDIVDRYDIKFIQGRFYEDGSFIWKYFAMAKKFYCIKDALYIYYRHHDSTMNKTFAKNNTSIDHMYVADDIYEFLVRNAIFEDFIDEFFSFYKSSFYFAKKYCDEERQFEIESLDAQLQEKYSRWFKFIEYKHGLERRNKTLASLRSKVKL